MSVGATKEKLLAWAQGVETCGERRMDPAGGFMLYKLAQFADAECCAWSAVSTLAAAVRVSERTVQYRMREFEAAGLIRRTGRVHQIETKAGVRELPIYQLAPAVEGLGFTACSGAASAPQDGASGAKSGAFGCKSLHPIIEPIEPNSETNVSSAGEGAREALFDEVQGAFHPRGLGFTHLDRARAHLWRLLDDGLDGAVLVRAAAAYTADRTVKNRDVGLDAWLANGRWRAWSGTGAAANDGPAAVAATFAGPPALRAALAKRLRDPAPLTTTLDLCGWDAPSRTLTPRTTFARDWLRQHMAGLVEAEGITLAEPAKTARTGNG